MPVRNSVELLDHGCTELRRAALDVVEYALDRADPYREAKGLVRLNHELLTVGDLTYDLSQRGEIYVLGAGKATLRIAQALEEILGPRIRHGLIALKRGQAHSLRYCRVIEAAHPYPDDESYLAARETMRLARQARRGDIIFAAVTGGSSSLWCYPADGITLEEKRQVHVLLLHCGADILEINAVRKHLSQIKGGLLARAALPAELVNLTVSDVIDDPLDYIAGPVVPDTSRVADAVHVLEKYELWDQVAPSVRAHLGTGDQAETPKQLDDRLIHTFVLIPSSAASKAAVVRAKELGFSPLLLTTAMEGESSEVGTDIGSVIRKIVQTGSPVSSPCAVIASGENTVSVLDAEGRGGPSQELALSLAVQLEGLPQVVVAALDTDGTDGPTQFAGGLVDSHSSSRARTLGYDISHSLRVHDASSALEAVGDIVYTGATGTNVADLLVILVGRQDCQ